jgi:hypothetical protein
MPLPTYTLADEHRREARLRRRLHTQGFALRKSRIQPENRGRNNQGGYMIVDPWLNAIVAGEHFDLLLDDVEEFVASR